VLNDSAAFRPNRPHFAQVTQGLRAFCAVATICLCIQVSTDAHAQQTNGGDFQSYPLEFKSAEHVERILTKLLAGSPDTRVIADTQSNQILLKGPADAQAVVRQLIESIDRPPVRQSVVKGYPVPRGQLNELATRLRNRYSNQPNLRVAADPETSQLLVLAPPETHQEIARSIKSPGDTPSAEQPPHAKNRPTGPGAWSLGTLKRRIKQDASRTRRTNPVERFVSLEKATVPQVEGMLGNLLGSRLSRKASERFDFVYQAPGYEPTAFALFPRRNGLLINGPESLVEQFVQLIHTLDERSTQPGQRVRIIPVRRSDPVKIRQAIEAYQSGYGRGQTSRNSLQPAGDIPSRPLGENHENDQSRVTYSNEIELVNFQEDPNGSLDDGNNTDDAAPLEDDSTLERDRIRGLTPDVEIETLPDLDVIIIRGRDRDVDEVTRIIKEIERLSAETVPEIEIYQLRHVGGDAVAELVQRISEDLVGGRQGRVSVTALVKPNALLLIGWGEAVKAAKELIEKLDQPVAPETQLKVFRLRHTSVTSASTIVQQFFAGRTGLGPRVVVNPDIRSNSLIVQAAPRDMQEIALLLKEIDTPKSGAVNQAKIFPLKNSLAADLAATLQTAIDSARGGQGTGAAAQKSSILELLTIDAEGERIIKSGILADVRITPDPHRNSLIISAPAESMDLLAALIRQLDDAPAAVAQIKVFRVINGDAGSLVQMLRSLLPSQTGTTTSQQLSSAQDESSLAPLRFSVDVRTNSIIASGSAGDLRIIEALLLRLDEEEVQHRKNTIYRLKNAPALDVARAINDFLRSERQVQQATPGSLSPFLEVEREVVVVPEPVANALIISATPRFFDEIQQLVERLDERPPMVMIQVLIAEVMLRDVDEFGVEVGIQDSLLFDRSLLGDLVTTTTTAQQSTPAGIVTATEDFIQAASNTPGFLFNDSTTTLPGLPNSGSDRSKSSSNSLAGQALSNFATGRINSELGFGGMVLSASNESLSVLIRALQENRRMEILSRPQVMTLDNQPAFIQIGERVPRIVASTISENAGQVNTVELTNTGILLGVTPRISPDGIVVMDIDAEKSEVGPDEEGIPVSVSPTGTVIRSPRIAVTQAQTTVSAYSGQTIVLGGLITKGTSLVHRRVPWLADIPLLGHLFRFDSTGVRRTELLIILTPHVVFSPEDAERIKHEEAARMHWCLADVHEIHGPTGLHNFSDCGECNLPVPVIYPDLNPRGQLPVEINTNEEHRTEGTVPPGPVKFPNGEQITTPTAFQRLSGALTPPLFKNRRGGTPTSPDPPERVRRRQRTRLPQQTEQPSQRQIEPPPYAFPQGRPELGLPDERRRLLLDREMFREPKPIPAD